MSCTSTKTGLHLIGNVLKLLAKKVLVPVGLTTAPSATDAAIEKNVLDRGVFCTWLCG